MKMAKQKITDVLKTGKILVSDGAWGTFLYQKGLKSGECPDEWSLTHYDIVRDVARSYFETGSDMVQTNSFGANRFKLQHFGLQDKVAEINVAAARASREAAGDDRYVIASIGPTGKMLLMGDVTEEEFYDCFREQAVAGEKAGADFAAIETMSDLAELEAAILAVTENTGLPVLATMTFNKAGRTFTGCTPESFAETVQRLGVAAAGLNCSLGPSEMYETAERIAKRTSLPLIIKPNAGLPDSRTGLYSIGPAEFARQMLPYAKIGAKIIGGCCGTTPEYIRDLKKAFTHVS